MMSREEREGGEGKAPTALKTAGQKIKKA